MKDTHNDIFTYIEQGNCDEVIRLLQEDPDIVRSRKNISLIEAGFTPLHLAAQLNKDDIVRVLLDNDADVHAKNFDGYEPIYVSLENMSRKTPAMLVEYGATVDYEILQGIVQNVVSDKKLSQKDYDSYIAFFKDITMAKDVKEIIKKDLNWIYEMDNDGHTFLHIAASNGLINVVKALLDGGANVNILSGDDATPLQVALQRGHKDIAKLLIEAGAYIYEDRALTPKNGLSDNNNELITDIRIKQVAKNLKKHADSETSEKDVDTMSPSSNPRNATIKSEERSTSR